MIDVNRGPAAADAIDFLRRSIAVGCVLLSAVLAAPSSSAAAKPFQSPTSAEFTVAGTNGYSLHVKSERGHVEVLASRENPPVATISITGRLRPANTNNVAASTYHVFGSHDPDFIDADFGDLGRISVAFQPSGEVRTTKLDRRLKTRKCVFPERIVRRLGTFAGTIEFQGENGYTAVNLPSAEGSVGTSPFRNCSTKPRPGSRARNSVVPELVYLSAMNPEADFVNFTASSGDGGPRFSAFLGEMSGDVSVFRSALAGGRKDSFAFGETLGWATVAPPSPFSGRASLRAGARSASPWTGSLRVAFPGVEVPLAGPGFEAKIRGLGSRAG